MRIYCESLLSFIFLFRFLFSFLLLLFQNKQIFACLRSPSKRKRDEIYHDQNNYYVLIFLALS